ncbi:flagellar basal-body MS-ring/collar protein FliF [Bacillus sp. REN16]|uniref:flagellar basal-body MS-ring/collar protein FliF n=1 Tax=Bacillus sp. REN16 TaxID=2887296 RepID=UPI001E53660D|nr:flagellar basal-body MS-ring/collar protein FliF [Bacillus sp. REN16]MCC3357476.1 flagellar M-ring protein FliF [Bacillus sp. REN16]
MKEKLLLYKTKISEFWKKQSGLQKTTILGLPLLLILVVSLTVFFTTKTTLVPLYSNLTPQETGQIKATLDSRGIQSEIADNGSTIKVPEEVVETLMVDLAAEGIPDSGNIDYSFFGENAGFGMTDNEFNMLKLESTQTELANLIKGIDGINDAKVMISMPNDGIFVKDSEKEASASIVLNTKPGYRFEQQQIKSLYHLVSKSIPNLPTDNIVITNQNFEYFDLENEENISVIGNVASQLELKREIEKDLQRQVQQMLGTMMGPDKIVVSVTTDIDFTQENRQENLVTPVNPENMDGIEISVERITETFTGDGAAAGGVVGTGETDVPSYNTNGQAGNGDYERIEERVNKDVNRITKEIVEAPYKIRDLGIQVMVEAPDPKDPASMPQERVDDIERILSTIVSTSINQDENNELTQEQIQDKIVVSVQEFSGKSTTVAETPAIAKVPLWIYIVGGLLVLGLIILLFLFLRKKRDTEIEDELPQSEPVFFDHIPDVNEEKESDAVVKRKQLEKLAKDKPEDFAKLLRSWLADE